MPVGEVGRLPPFPRISHQSGEAVHARIRKQCCEPGGALPPRPVSLHASTRGGQQGVSAGRAEGGTRQRKKMVVMQGGRAASGGLEAVVEGGMLVAERGDR